jgi:hypothetical protein
MAIVKLKPRKHGSNVGKALEEAPVFSSRAERLGEGRNLRDNVPRSSHADVFNDINRLCNKKVRSRIQKPAIPDKVLTWHLLSVESAQNVQRDQVYRSS